MSMAKLPKVIYVMGPPGAGKGTQAEFLAKKIGYHRFSTGDAFRAITRQDTKLGRRVKEAIDNGYLAPAQMAAEVVISAIRQYVEADRGLIFDGTPRTIREAQLVDDFFKEEGYGRPLAILLKVEKGDMMERNSKRKFCLDVAGDFPVITMADARRCHKLGGRVGIRPDDDPDKFETRWKEFMSNTWPVIQKYREEKILHEVNGKKSIPAVHKQVMAVIESVAGN
jgi:adenylate kinase